jgi:hypothetical protein
VVVYSSSRDVECRVAVRDIKNRESMMKNATVVATRRDNCRILLRRREGNLEARGEDDTATDGQNPRTSSARSILR